MAYEDLLGWTVGRFDWLNSENSKVNRYWRVIEEGSEATKWPFVGKTIVGLWGNSAGSNSRPGSLQSGDLQIPESGRANQKFVPFFATLNSDQLGAKRAAIWFLFDGGKRNMDLIRGNSPNEKKRFLFWLLTKATVNQIPFVAAYVQRPIKPAHYYLKAKQAYDPVQRDIDLLRQETAYFMRGHDFSTASGLKKARALVAFDSADGTAPRTGRRGGDSGSPSGAALASVRVSASTGEFTRNSRGQFTVYTDIVRKVNRQLAQEFQAEVVNQITSHRSQRPQTGDLVRATQDRRNRSPE